MSVVPLQKNYYSPIQFYVMGHVEDVEWMRADCAMVDKPVGW
jgi:hypothetical protein